MQMTQNTTQKETHFYTIGISYKKADADMRGLFSLDAEHQERILSLSQQEGMEGLAILSTCNRTELYGFAQHPFQLIQKLCAHSKATLEDFAATYAELRAHKGMTIEAARERMSDPSY
ncbi:MAG: hypothetical protein ACFNJP_07405, partial [Capnocytophaga gingivalis]